MTPFSHPAHRTGQADLPHPALGQDFTPLLLRATPSAASEHSAEFIGCPISRSFTTYFVCLELRSLPSTGITRLQRYYEPLRHPKAPSLSLTGLRLVVADRALGLPVFRALSLCTCCRHYPGAASGRITSLISSRRSSLPRKGCRVGLRIVLFEACSAFTRVAACTLALPPIRDTLIEGFSHFVASMTAPIASGWSGCRVGLAPTGKRRLVTAHTPNRTFWRGIDSRLAQSCSNTKTVVSKLIARDFAGASMFPTLSFGDQEITPPDLAIGSAKAADVLASIGIAEGDTFAVMLRNSPTLIEIMLAARQIGAYFVPLNWHFKTNEAGYILRDSGAKALVINGDLLAQICKGIPPGMLLLEVKPDSGADVQRDSGITSLRNIDWYARWKQAKPLAKVSDRPRGMIAYTSGTTGLPKGVRRVPPRPEEVTVGAERMARMFQAGLGIKPDARCLVSAPLYHSAPASYVAFASLWTPDRGKDMRQLS